jgi:hypothetical protein
MEAWWEGLTALNKGFALAALFFSVLFAWQIICMLIGFDVHGTSDVSHDGFDSPDGHADAGAAVSHQGYESHDAEHQLGGEVTFSLVTVRSVLAFATLFTWAGTLYLMKGTSPIVTLALSALWGLAAMLGVSYIVYKLVQLQEIGNVSLWTAIGEEGVVYMDVPAQGAGKVRVKVGGVVSFIDARSGTGSSIAAGTKVQVSRVIDSRSVEVVPFEHGEGG